MTFYDFCLLFLAAMAAGAVNALAGGGTLISFPVLLALGVPPIAANVTNAVALCPGYFGATFAQRRNLDGQAKRLRVLIPVALLGGIVGASILLHTHERTFEALVPYMLFLAAFLLAIQDRVRAFVLRTAAAKSGAQSLLVISALTVFLASVYGGFFSAGMSVILLAVLALSIHESFTHLNALKQVLASCVNVAAAVFFLFSDQVLWTVAAVMAIGALAGGAIGGRIARQINPSALRWIVVTVGFSLAIYYWVKG